MNFISKWKAKELTCSCCGTTRSVKWQHLNKPFCNACILGVSSTSTEHELNARIEGIKKRQYERLAV